jgi:hypothetical protein
MVKASTRVLHEATAKDHPLQHSNAQHARNLVGHKAATESHGSQTQPKDAAAWLAVCIDPGKRQQQLSVGTPATSTLTVSHLAVSTNKHSFQQFSIVTPATSTYSVATSSIHQTRSIQSRHKLGTSQQVQPPNRYNPSNQCTGQGII